jgi:hypothetical protein
MRYRDFVDDLSHITRDMSPDGLLRRLRFASDTHLLPDGDGNEELLTLITRFTQAVKTVWDTIFHREIQTQRMADDAPPKHTNREWCRMYIEAFYKAKLLRGVPTQLQHAFRVFLRSLDTVFLVDGEDTARSVMYLEAAPPPPSSPTTVSHVDDVPAPHPYHVLRDRFSSDMQGTASATTVTSFVSAHMDGHTQVCSLRTPPSPFNIIMHCYRITDGVPDNAYARLNVHVDAHSHVHDALNTFLLNVANDVLERGGTHREV